MNEQNVIENEFEAIIQLIGINPYVLVPQQILDSIFSQAGRSKSPIAIRGKINGKPYLQRLVKYRGNGDYTSIPSCLKIRQNVLGNAYI
ncbi:MAG: hypothetical protein ACTJHT_02190 [Sphingobacterium sp.]|uniref:hypothetical protein n=1 Tax=Sphingobacterium sp. JB170 TaxID=1434842 RepID=UPI00097EFF81|nr:hypothetical protein [Sphingobacterium sp. JB170]SJN39906.1 hypothetical protein FM107_10350 [Sphingobacterium sp. JB170]